MVGLRANTESALSRLIYPSDLTLLLQAERDIVIEYRYLNVKNLTNHLKKISIWIGIAKLFCFSSYKSINQSIKNIKSIKNINALNDQGINPHFSSGQTAHLSPASYPPKLSFG